MNGIQILTTDPTTTLVDLVFVTGNASSRNFRMEGRAAAAKTGANSFQFGNSDLTNPTISVGDAYAGITKLAVGSYTNPEPMLYQSLEILLFLYLYKLIMVL